MSKTINFEELGRKEIKALVYSNLEDNVITEYNQDRISKLLPTLEYPIIIKNPSDKAQKEIVNMLVESEDDKNKNTLVLQVKAVTVITKLVPLLTNINLSLDPNIEEDLNRINEIVSNPSDTLKAVIRVLTNIVKAVSDNLLYNIDTIKSLPEDEKKIIVNKLVESSVEQENKRKKLLELEEQIKHLKSEIEVGA